MPDDLVLLDLEAERFHEHDPDDMTWNESWLVSWLPGDGTEPELGAVAAPAESLVEVP